MDIQYKSISKCGKRIKNEDAFKVIDDKVHNQWLGIVCDGLGGHPHGEIASKLVCDAISQYWEGNVNQEDDKQKVYEACENTQRAVDSMSDELNHIEMGTTLAMVSLRNKTATIAWLGDSRVYYANSKEDVFYRTKDDVKLNYDQIVISRCFFSYRTDWKDVSVIQFPIMRGTRILLCSDGVYNAMEYAAPALLRKSGLGNETPERYIEIVDSTCAKFGDDNYTAIIAMVNNETSN